MKTKKYFLIVISFLLVVSTFYSSTNSISSISDLAPNKKKDYTSAQLAANLEQDISSTPQLSQTITWDDNGSIICNEETQDRGGPQICYDEAGGAIITWDDNRNGNWDIYAQKIDSAGDTKWDANGTVMCNEDTASQRFPQICCDGDGGAIIMWQDYRNGNSDIYAQKIDSAGDTQWDNNGTVICNATQDQGVPQICSDGDGGAIITWEDYRNGNSDIYAQKIDSAGDTQWGDGSFWGDNPDWNGTVICNATRDQVNPQICCNDTGGTIITWEDYRNGIGKIDIYAQKIDSAGDTQWGDGSFWGDNPDWNGTVICNENTAQQRFPKICCDGAGGAIIIWQDYRNGGGNSDIYAQKIALDGSTEWDNNGTAICNATQDQGGPQICCDGAGGAIITWQDYRNGVADIYAQKIDSAGDTQWGDGSTWGLLDDRNGTVICNEDTQGQEEPQICCNGAGGAIITWQDWRNGNGDIYAQKIDSAGNTQWGDGSTWGLLDDRNGTVICNEDPENQRYPQICGDGDGGAIITWEDYRSSNWDIYAQKIKGVSGGAGLGLPSADDDDDDDDDDTGVVVLVIIVVVILACIGLGVVVMILIKKGIIDVSKLKKK